MKEDGIFVPVTLYGNVGIPEIGASLLLPDGRAWFIDYFLFPLLAIEGVIRALENVHDGPSAQGLSVGIGL